MLETTAQVMTSPQSTILSQYFDITGQGSTLVETELIPYYTWNNREEPKMSVWLPLIR